MGMLLYRFGWSGRHCGKPYSFSENWTRLKMVAKSRRVSVTKLIEEMAAILLANFDAETRFELRAARGRGRIAEGLALLDKAAGKRVRSERTLKRWW
jgi:hypothetical protein